MKATEFTNEQIHKLPRLSGALVVRKMRRAKITIKQAAQIMGVSQARVREVRKHGTASGMATWEWYYFMPEQKA